MKLSVKWLAGLAVLALAVVAVVGSTSATKAAEGKVFVANEWSKRTNENPAPSGYTTAGTVYATYSTATRLIQTNSDLVKVVVTDTGKDTLTGVTVATGNIDVDDSNNGAGGGDDNTMTTVAGSQVTIFLTSHATSPIAGANSTIKILSGATDLIADGTLSIVSRFNGISPSADPWIRVQRNTGTGTITLTNITYQTSQQDTVNIFVKTDLEASGTGITVIALETDLSTARFVGYVRLVNTTITSTPSTAAGDQNAKIRTSAGPATFEYTDSDMIKRSTNVTVDTSAPAVSVTGPANGTATQNRRPTFSASVSETGSGLQIDQIQALYDSSNDAGNTNPVLTNGGANGAGATALSISTSGAVNGDLSFSFSQAPTIDIPTFGGTPDHIVDWMVRVSDIAGNWGFSDANPSDATTPDATSSLLVTGGFQAHEVKIDQTIPALVPASSKTGLSLNSAGAEVASRKHIRVVFNDQVQSVQASDFTVTLDSGATVVPVAVTISNNPSAFPGQGVVYLEFLNDLVSSETPIVALQDTVQDLAGNSTATGSITVADGIAPKLTVTILNGTGAGTGSEASNSLTKDKIDIQVSSDEPLNNVPTVAVHVVGNGTAEATPAALSQGTNTWRATYDKAAVTTPATGDRAVVVTAADAATNAATVGATGTKSFRLDLELGAATVKAGGSTTSTSQVRPTIVIDFAAGSPAESGTVTVSELLLDGTNVTGQLVASSNKTRFFLIPSSDLTQASHTISIPIGKAKDAAGNTNTAAISLTFTVVARATFDVAIFVGWNAISFPSPLVDPSVDAAFGGPGVGVDIVMAFDPSVPGQFRFATRDLQAGATTFSTTAQNGLTSVDFRRAHWARSGNFESVKVLLVGETLPGDAQPPAVVSLSLVVGFNPVPVIDTSRKQTTGASGANLVRTNPNGSTTPVTVDTYLAGVTKSRVLLYNPETATFTDLAGNTVIKVGDVLHVLVTTAGSFLP